MFRTLLVPLDGSELAERALPYATALASAAGGKLALVRVALAPPPATLDGATWVQEQSDQLDRCRQRRTLVLVSVVESSEEVVRDEFGHIREYLDQQEEALTGEARDYLHTIAGQLVEQHPGLQVSVEVRVGAPAAGVIAVSAERLADLVVMASHGRTGIRRAIFGSVTGAVLRDGFTPVLVVHPRISATAASSPVARVR